MLNGHPKVMSSFARVMGYVEQVDVHIAQATVKEALLLSAQLRLSDVAPSALRAFVDEVSDRAV
jgi:ABC-type multidrug transport system ATPase subunit